MMTQKELNALTSTIYMAKLMANNGKLDDDDKKIRASGLYSDWVFGNHKQGEIYLFNEKKDGLNGNINFIKTPVKDGKISLDDRFVKYLPESALGMDCDIAVRDLAMHAGGFDNNKPYNSKDMKVFHRELLAMRPVRPRLSAFEYSCANFILLGKIINNATGEDLDSFARRRIWEPLGMKRTQWNPPGDGPDEVEHWFPNAPRDSTTTPYALIARSR